MPGRQRAFGAEDKKAPHTPFGVDNTAIDIHWLSGHAFGVDNAGRPAPEPCSQTGSLQQSTTGQLLASAEAVEFEVLEKLPQEGNIKIFDEQFGWRPPEAFTAKLEE